MPRNRAMSSVRLLPPMEIPLGDQRAAEVGKGEMAREWRSMRQRGTVAIIGICLRLGTKVSRSA